MNRKYLVAGAILCTILTLVSYVGIVETQISELEHDAQYSFLESLDSGYPMTPEEKLALIDKYANVEIQMMVQLRDEMYRIMDEAGKVAYTSEKTIMVTGAVAALSFGILTAAYILLHRRDVEEY